VAAVLALTLLPAHYHIHHPTSVDPSAHSHTVDLHVLSSMPDSTHHDSSEASFATTPDGFVKKQDSTFHLFLILAIFLICLPILYKPSQARPFNWNIPLKRTYFYLTPPLRAPPLH